MKIKSVSRFDKLNPQESLKKITVSYADLIGTSVIYPESQVDKSFFETSQTAVKRIKSLGGFDAPLPYDANPFALSAEVARMRSRGVDSAEVYQASIRAEKQLNQMLSSLGQSAAELKPEISPTTTVEESNT